MQTETIEVIAITETFVDTINNDLISEDGIGGFKFFNKDRNIGKGSGVALYIVTWLNSVEITPNESNIQPVCVKVTGDELADNISITYRPPGQTQDLDSEVTMYCD